MRFHLPLPQILLYRGCLVYIEWIASVSDHAQLEPGAQMLYFESDGRMVVLRGIIIRYSKKKVRRSAQLLSIEDELVEYKRGIHRVHREFVFVPLGAPFLTFLRMSNPWPRLNQKQGITYILPCG
jgi:hypothetical protein